MKHLSLKFLLLLTVILLFSPITPTVFAQIEDPAATEEVIAVPIATQEVVAVSETTSVLPETAPAEPLTGWDILSQIIQSPLAVVLAMFLGLTTLVSKIQNDPEKMRMAELTYNAVPKEITEKLIAALRVSTTFLNAGVKGIEGFVDELTDSVPADQKVRKVEIQADNVEINKPTDGYGGFDPAAVG